LLNYFPSFTSFVTLFFLLLLLLLELDLFQWKQRRAADYDFSQLHYPANLAYCDYENTSIDQFIEWYEKPKLPVIIKGVTHDWKAKYNWTPEVISIFSISLQIILYLPFFSRFPLMMSLLPSFFILLFTYFSLIDI